MYAVAQERRKNMKRYLLGIDIGTSACKVALFDAQGTVIAQRTGAYPVYYPKAGWAEQDPCEWKTVIYREIRELLQSTDIRAEAIAGIGVDGQSWSAIAIDKHGNVLTNTPIWTDTRARVECDQIRALVGDDAYFAICGNPIQPSYTLPKILWYKNNMPNIYQKTAYILQSNSYIVYCLTGVVSQDLSQGYGLGCFDIRKGQWDTAMMKTLGIRDDLLPPIYACHEVVGHVTQDAAKATGLSQGTPVVAGGLDAACGTLGAGVIGAGQTQEQGGQAGGMSICMDQYAADQRLILGCHVVPGKWLLQGGTTGGGGALKWLRETVCPDLSFEQMSDLAVEVPAGSEGILFLPYMAGERSPIWNPHASGVFFGLNYAKTRGHLIRAVMEGVAYALRHNLEIAKIAGAHIDTLMAMGGSANSRIWTQIKADITGHRMAVPASDTATTLGAVILAGVGTGVYDSFEDAVAQTVCVQREHEPAVAREVYDQGFTRYLELYERLAPMMTEQQ